MKKRIIMLGLACMMALGNVGTASAMTMEEYEEWDAMSAEEQKELLRQDNVRAWFTQGDGREHMIQVDKNLEVAFFVTGVLNVDGETSKYDPETFEIYLDGEYMGTPEEVYLEKYKGNGMKQNDVYNSHFYEIPYGDYLNGKISYSFGGITVDEYKPVADATGEYERTEEGYKSVPTFANKYAYPDSIPTTDDNDYASDSETPEDYEDETANTATNTNRDITSGGVENLSDILGVYADMSVETNIVYSDMFEMYGALSNRYEAVGGQWYKDAENSWCYKLANGETAVSGWLFDGQYWYCVSQYGKAAESTWLRHLTNETNSMEIADIYLFDENCHMVTGWKEVNGQWYYMNESGLKQVSCVTPDGYTLDANGVWVQ